MKHVSSFIGNVGDVLSNYGFYSYLLKHKNDEVEQIEIRGFYKNIEISKRKDFDTLFNTCQLTRETLVIGGGGFLDYWVENSRTATTIDVSLKLLEETDFKLIITSIGSYPHKDVSEANVEKFKKFITILKNRKNTSVMLRNDGSFDDLSSTFPASLIEGLKRGADNAYLLEPMLSDYKKTTGNYVLLNVAPDQLTMKSKLRDAVDYNNFKLEIIKTVRHIIISLKKNVVLVPHLLEDVKFYIEICSELDDLLVRKHIKIFSYSGQVDDIHEYIDVYAKSYANVCTRLHSNVLSAMLNKKTISLCVLDRVRAIASQHDNLFELTDFNGNFSYDIVNILKSPEYKPNSSFYYSLLDDFYSKNL